jgi:hypothetical protein
VDDDDKGISHEQWREKWIKGGMKWQSHGIAAPKDWNAERQLAMLTGIKPKSGKAARLAKATTRLSAKKTKIVPKKAKTAKVAVKKQPTGARKRGSAAKKKGNRKKR